MGQRVDALLCGGADMNAEELRKAMMYCPPQPSPEKRLDWLEADSAAQRTAILKLERELKRLSLAWAGVAAIAGLLALAVLT